MKIIYAFNATLFFIALITLVLISVYGEITWTWDAITVITTAILLCLFGLAVNQRIIR